MISLFSLACLVLGIFCVGYVILGGLGLILMELWWHIGFIIDDIKESLKDTFKR